MTIINYSEEYVTTYSEEFRGGEGRTRRWSAGSSAVEVLK